MSGPTRALILGAIVVVVGTVPLAGRILEPQAGAVPGQAVPGGPAIPGAPGQIPPRDNHQSKPATSVVRGRVFAADTGQPLRKVLVRITSQSPPTSAGAPSENRLATTDASGGYEFKELPAGRYQLTATKGSYISLQYGQRRALEPGTPLDLIDGHVMERVDFTLPRGAVITGRILDEFGEPVTDANVSLERYQYMSNGRRLIPTGRSAQTNDIGEFRLFAVPPGDYYLSARLVGAPFGNTADRSGYAATYYPGTPEIASAQKLTVGLGQTLHDLTMALIPTRTAQVSGTAMDSEGRPLTSGMLIVAQLNGASMGTANQVRPDGTFSVSNLTSGEYLLMIQQTTTGIGMPTASGESASASVTVAGSDVTGVRLVGVKPRNVTGRLVIDAASAKTLRPSTIRIQAVPAVIRGFSLPFSVEAGAFKDDWSFTIQARPQVTRLNLIGLPAAVALKAIRVGGVDVIDSGVDIRPNEDVTDVEIELTNKVTVVTGAVTNSRGEPVSNYSVVAFSRNRDRWASPTRFTRSVRPDQSGRYKLDSLPPGDYYAVAVDFIEPGSWGDSDVLDRLRAKASTFSLREGETKAVDLKLAE